MSILNYNKNVAYFDYDKEKERPYVKLEELYKENGSEYVYKVLGLYINSGKYGEQGTAVLDSVQVNLPMHLTETIRNIRENEDVVEDINKGKVGFKIYKYEPKKYNTTSYSIVWVELK